MLSFVPFGNTASSCDHLLFTEEETGVRRGSLNDSLKIAKLKSDKMGSTVMAPEVRAQDFPITSHRRDIPRKEGHCQFSSRLYSQHL